MSEQLTSKENVACVWRGGCKDERACNAAGCCQQITLAEQPSSNTGFVCADCKNVFLQAPRCATCGAEKLYDATVRNLQEDNARYENGRVVLLGEIEELKKKLSARLQQIEELRMAERMNVETVAALQKERDELKVDLDHRERYWAQFDHYPKGSAQPPKECPSMQAIGNHLWGQIEGCLLCKVSRQPPTKEDRRKFKIGDCVQWGCNRKGVVQGPADEGTRVLVKWQGTQIIDAIEGSELLRRGCDACDEMPSIHSYDANGSPVPDCPHCDGFEVDGTVLHGPRCPAVETDEPPCDHEWLPFSNKDAPIQIDLCVKCKLEKHTSAGSLIAVRPVSEEGSR